jgi:poly(3-hydroxyoctanoate) depolymerase
VTSTASQSDAVVSADGIEFFVRERGEGRPVVIVNGLGGLAEMLEPIERRLSTSARTIAIELPGGGRSPTPRRPLSIAALGKVTNVLLAELGLDEVDVLGFSLGGIVAQQLAHEAPARIRRMALVGTACGWGSVPGSHEALALMAMPYRFHSRTLYERTATLLGPADRELMLRLPALTEARLAHPPPLLGYAYQLTAGALWSSLTWLSSVEIPTLVLCGEEDRLVPAANAIQLARLLPQSRLHVIPGEGHLFVCDPKSGSLPLLDDFFSSPTAEGSQAWQTGTEVSDDETVEAAFKTAGGAQPQRALSDAYRRYVQRL